MDFEEGKITVVTKNNRKHEFKLGDITARIGFWKIEITIPESDIKELHYYSKEKLPAHPSRPKKEGEQE